MVERNWEREFARWRCGDSWKMDGDNNEEKRWYDT